MEPSRSEISCFSYRRLSGNSNFFQNRCIQKNNIRYIVDIKVSQVRLPPTRTVSWQDMQNRPGILKTRLLPAAACLCRNCRQALRLASCLVQAMKYCMPLFFCRVVCLDYLIRDINCLGEKHDSTAPLFENYCILHVPAYFINHFREVF